MVIETKSDARVTGAVFGTISWSLKLSLLGRYGKSYQRAGRHTELKFQFQILIPCDEILSGLAIIHHVL
ncbi:MAG: hypothetical protein D6675_15150 [Gemmatimonadetes bacterium]|nr:MAG: hypothetical protein D6675_15150 [Gemmatimonadota bacterium]